MYNLMLVLICAVAFMVGCTVIGVGLTNIGKGLVEIGRAYLLANKRD